jgi:hypothetical protein
MDGAVYHGDPSDRSLMRQNVAACTRGVRQIEQMHPSALDGPEKLFILARILDRTATLSYIGLDDTAMAFTDVRRANLYFRIALGLPNQSTDFREAALANVELTAVQLQTLRADLAAAAKSHSTSVALRVPHAKETDR